ncbi:uncharacterized protein DS421_9g269770 [Arachis hypogaea]|nr:uncharacterized protein DS421_9g269770 [Arachis hypogaea]
MQKIDQLLNCLSTIPETPTNSGESTSRIQTHTSKTINNLNQDSNESSSDQSDDSDKSFLKVSPIMTNSMTKLKGLTKPSAYSYNRVSAPDLALEERELGTTFQATHETSEEAIANVIVSGFSGQLKGWELFPDAVNTLIFTIASHFIGYPSLWKDRSAELLSNLICKTLSEFRWYKDIFLTKVYTREDSQQPF